MESSKILIIQLERFMKDNKFKWRILQEVIDVNWFFLRLITLLEMDCFFPLNERFH